MRLIRFGLKKNIDKQEKCCPKCGVLLIEGVCVNCGSGSGAKPAYRGHDTHKPAPARENRSNAPPIDGEAFIDLIGDISDLVLSAEDSIQRMTVEQLYLRESDINAHICAIESILSRLLSQTDIGHAQKLYADPTPSLKDQDGGTF